MGLRIIRPGAFLTIQDGGRKGYQRYGVSESGACDRESMALANLIIGNQPDQAVLEATLIGPAIEFTSDTVIAVTGADMEPEINGKAVDSYCPIKVTAGDTLSFGQLKSGLRMYIAFYGGLKTEPELGSRSTDMRAGIGGLAGEALKTGDYIETWPLPSMEDTVNISRRKTEPPVRLTGSYVIRVIPGPEEDRFTDKGIRSFFTEEYEVTEEFDRMGVRLRGPAIEHRDGADIISNGIPFGAIQVADNGQPIIMMSDRQTVGGYTKIGCVASVDLPLIAQAKAGDRLRFREISVSEAQELIKERKRSLEKLFMPEGSASDKKETSTKDRTNSYRVIVNGREFFVTVAREMGE